MLHYTYKVKTDSGKYYVGRHSTENIDDGYLGSGKWVRSIKDKSCLTKEIISFYESFEALCAAEADLLKEHVGKPNCMNFNNSPVGFATGDLNVAKTDSEREKRRKRATEDNPARRPGVGEKIRKANKGKKLGPRSPMSEEGRRAISIARKGATLSEEGRKKLSESRKRQYANGERVLPSFSGMTHTAETKEKISNAAKNRPMYKCIHCNRLATPQNIKRWHNDNCKDKPQ